METRILDRAAETGAPRAEPSDVARLLGADLAALQAQLEPGVPADTRTVTGCGLHLDQAAAAFAVMTSERRLDAIVGPAGTGKSRTIAAIARIWPQLHQGGRVIALTETQQGANVLRSMGVADSHNISMFLADPRLRDIPAGSIVIADEASMVTMPHLDALTRITRQNDAKATLAGDPAQHQAVSSGGGMAMITRRQRFLQLGEALRFSREWERDASLRLRLGDAAVLAEYDQQGRILAGTAEEMTEEAYRRWLTDYLNGKDSVLTAHNQEDCDDLSRRARADLIRYGRVSRSREAQLRAEVSASAGDRIMARHTTAKDGLTNRDVYEVDQVRADGSVVARLLRKDGTFDKPRTLTADYLKNDCHLAYGVTSFSVQGETFNGNGYALVRPENSREFAYTALSRAAEANYAFVVAEDPQRETETPGAAPEVARSRALAAERSGENPGADLARTSGAGILAQVLARSDSELSATETMTQAFSEADSAAVLGRIWTDLSGREYSRRYHQVLRDHLGDHAAGKVAGDNRYTWLCRTLRAAELAGISGDQVLRQAVSQGSLTDAESVAAVLDHRARQIIPGTLPLDGGWAARGPRQPEPGTDQLLAQVGQAMDERTARLGEHTARTLPLWAERTLGTVPCDPLERETWQLRAGAIAFYRDMTGYRSPGDPIGPAPAATAPEARAAWHTALIALAKVDGIDLSEMTPAQLQIRRNAYERETALAPVHPGRELRLSIQVRDQAAERAARSQREAAIAPDTETRTRHLEHAARWAEVRDRAAAAAEHYGMAIGTWQNWRQLAEPTLRAGMAADLEARRRDPWARLEPVRSGEPVSSAVAGDPEASDADVLTALGLTFELPEASDHPQHLAEAARARQAELDEIASMREPAEDPDLEPGEAWGQAATREREAISQPAAPVLRPSERVLDVEAEAG